MKTTLKNSADSLRPVEKLKGKSFCALLQAIAKRSDSFSLVWRDECRKFKKSATELAVELSPFLLAEKHTNRWPGTVLYESRAVCRFYRIDRKALAALEQPGALFDFLHPAWPEDLCFYAKDNCVFCSITHEGDAFLRAGVIGDAELREELPFLHFNAEMIGFDNF